ncbi:MAG: aminotransferase class I/II-fold pyridoxal phosphate-dependent enzyme [Nocardioidaceae bacterium]
MTALPPPAGGPLDLDPEELRRLGHWVVDRTVEHLTTLRDRPAITTASYDDLVAVLGGALPVDRRPVEEGLELLADVALEHQQHGDHPRYFARVPGPSSPVAILGDWLATGMQAIASSWGGGSGTATLELVALGWLRDALGLPAAAEGVLCSGGSMANTTALATARAEMGPGIVYVSDQTHSSIGRSLRALGWDAAEIRVVPTDASYRLTGAALGAAVAADRAAGLRPSVVVATAGSTNTGAVDELVGLAEVAAEHGLWLHVDGAYGGPAALAADRNGIAGLDRVDSFVLDPHKWLFQPYDLGCVWVCRPGALERTFAMHPEYLVDAQAGGHGPDGEADLHNRGFELSRRARGAKLWLTLRTYGLPTLVAAVQRGVELAEVAERLVAADERLEVVTPASLGVTTFAVVGLDDAAHRRVAADVTADGFAALTSTVLSGRTVLRLCTINPATTDDDLRRTVALVAALATGVGGRGGDGSPR